MDILKNLFENIQSLIPAGAAVIGTILVVFVVRQLLLRRFSGASGQTFRRQLITMVLTFAGLLVIVLVLPVNDSIRGQLLSLIGILLTAAIALSATTFLGNIMAGFMLRVVKGFRPGDFIRVGEYFGRVSEQGLFHVEIQTEDRDLTTMPNLYLVTNPVKVIRSSGTIISAEVSLGYEIPRKEVEALLLEAARTVPLREPFVYVMELGNFSITYRISGLLEEVKQVLSTRSRLREIMLDKLHGGGVEIVSPTFMNTRAFETDRSFIPREDSETRRQDGTVKKTAPEAVVFDKADEAESLEKLRERYELLGREIEKLKEQMKNSDNDSARGEFKNQIEMTETRRERLSELIAIREKESD